MGVEHLQRMLHVRRHEEAVVVTRAEPIGVRSHNVLPKQRGRLSLHAWSKPRRGSIRVSRQPVSNAVILGSSPSLTLRVQPAASVVATTIRCVGMPFAKVESVWAVSKWFWCDVVNP